MKVTIVNKSSNVISVGIFTVPARSTKQFTDIPPEIVRKSASELHSLEQSGYITVTTTDDPVDNKYESAILDNVVKPDGTSDNSTINIGTATDVSTINIGNSDPDQNIYFPGGLSITTVDALPVASAAYRGRIWILRGGLGTGDVAYVCNKNAANTYQWDVVSNAIVNPQNVLTVGKNSSAMYTSVKTAVEAVSGATFNNQWLITIDPGVYNEAPFTIPSYVAVVGNGKNDSVRLVTTNNASHFVTLSPDSTIANLSMSGPSGVGYACIVRTANSATGPSWAHDIRLFSGYYGILCSPTVPVVNQCVVHGYNISCIFPVGMNTCFKVSAGGNLALVGCGAINFVPGAVSYGYYVSGSGADLDLENCFFRCAGDAGHQNTAVFVDNDAECRSIGFNAMSGYRGLHVGNMGTITEVNFGGYMEEGELVIDIQVDGPAPSVTFNGSATQSKIVLGVGADLHGSFTQITPGSEMLYVYGDLVAKRANEFIPITEYIHAIGATGVEDFDGISRTAGLGVNVGAGEGYFAIGDGITQFNWTATPANLPNNTQRIWITVDIAGIIHTHVSAPSPEDHIILGEASTSGGNITFLTDYSIGLRQRPALEYDRLNDTTGPLAVSGGVVTKHAIPSVQLDVDNGSYYAHNNKKLLTGAAPITFVYWYRAAVTGWTSVTGSTSIDTTKYDDGTGVLHAMTGGKYKRDLVFASVNNSGTEFHVVYGQQEFNAPVDATLNPSVPTWLEQSAIRLAGVIVLASAADIDSIVDQRPRLGQLASGSTAVTRHGDLSGLGNDDHTQYQLRSEQGAANGYPELDASALVPATQLPIATTNPVASDASAGDPGGSGEVSDAAHKHPVTFGVPVSIGTANAIGAGPGVSNNAHVHAHGAQTDPTHHAVATTADAGFMSSTDKTRLEALAAGNITIPVRNETGGVLLKGKAVAIVGWSIGSHVKLVDYADKDDPALRPAIGILADNLNDATTGSVVVQGLIEGIDTSTYSMTDQLVLGNAGAFTRPPPDNDPFTGEIQNLGFVARVDAVDGHIIVSVDGLNAVTADQVFALGGTNGSPSKTNKYVTNSDPRNSDSRTPLAHVHPLATGASDGFLSAAGFTALSVAVPNTRTITAGNGLSGGGDLSSNRTISAAAHADASIAVSAAGIQVGVLASDAQHGSRGGGTQHAAVIAAGASGFMTGADKTKLDGIATGATNTPISVNNPSSVGTANNPGGGSQASAYDHVHDHGSQTTGTHHAAAIAGGTSGFMTGADKTKLDSLPYYKQTVYNDLAVDTNNANATWVSPGGDLLTSNITTTAGTRLIITATAAFSFTTNNRIGYFRVLIDGTPGRGFAASCGSSGTQSSVSRTKVVTGLAAGAHTIVLQWRVSAGTAQIRPVSQPDAECVSLVIQEVVA